MRCKCCDLAMGDVPINPHTGDLEDFCSTCKARSKDSIEVIEYIQGMQSESIFSQLRQTGCISVAELDYTHDLLLNK
jgi:hypothetical protein